MLHPGGCFTNSDGLSRLTGLDWQIQTDWSGPSDWTQFFYDIGRFSLVDDTVFFWIRLAVSAYLFKLIVVCTLPWSKVYWICSLGCLTTLLASLRMTPFLCAEFWVNIYGVVLSELSNSQAILGDFSLNSWIFFPADIGDVLRYAP